QLGARLHGGADHLLRTLGLARDATLKLRLLRLADLLHQSRMDAGDIDWARRLLDYHGARLARARRRVSTSATTSTKVGAGGAPIGGEAAHPLGQAVHPLHILLAGR